MKLVFIIVVLVIISSVFGFGYYYFEIKQPKAYAKTIVALFEKLEMSAGLSLDSSLLSTTTDYFGAADILFQKKESLQEVRHKLSKTEPPRKMKEAHQNLTNSLDFFIFLAGTGQKRADFFKGLNKLNEEIKNLFQSFQARTPARPGTPSDFPTTKEIQNRWKEMVPKIKTAGTQAFGQEAVELKEISFDELKSEWEKNKQNLDILLSLILLFNPNLAVNEAQNVLTSEQTKQGEKAMKELQDFQKLLDSLIFKNPAADILNFSFLTSQKQVELSERSIDFFQIIQNLKKISVE